MKLSIHLKKKDDTEYYVYVSLFHNGKRTLIATDYIISGKFVQGGKIKNMSKYAEIYNNEVLKYQYRIDRIIAPEMLDVSDIKSIITSNNVDNIEAVDFFEFAEEYISDISRSEDRKGTAYFYGVAIKKFRGYVNRSKYYTFELTSSIINRYIDYLSQSGIGPTTIKNHINSLRIIFNACKNKYNDYDLGILNIKNDPFRLIKISRSESKAGFRALSLTDIRKIIYADFGHIKGDKQRSVLERGRDLYLLSFFLLGINPTDLFNLKKSDYKDGRIVYNRKKTKRRSGGAYISIPVCKQAEELIEKWKGREDDEYLLVFHSMYKGNGLPSFNFTENYALKILHEELGLSIDIKYFSWYSARHTWASIAANECRFSDAEVARALNHQSEHRVTRGYIRPDWSLLDRMNDAVLNIVFN